MRWARSAPTFLRRFHAAAVSRRHRDGSPSLGVEAVLHYQRPPNVGETVGRVIDGGPPGVDASRLTDVHRPTTVHVSNARAMMPPPALETCGFELRRAPTAVSAEDLADKLRAETVFYPEVEALIRLSSGCERVIVFDHTLRESGVSA